MKLHATELFVYSLLIDGSTNFGLLAFIRTAGHFFYL
nr:MAG TPA: hypothetical protein [Caudoviricetes sp.]